MPYIDDTDGSDCEYEEQQESEKETSLEEVAKKLSEEVSIQFTPEQLDSVIKYCRDKILTDKFETIEKTLIYEIIRSLKTHIGLHSKTYVQEQYNKALMSEVHVGSSWNEIKLSIKDVIQKELADTIESAKRGNNSFYNDIFERFVRDHISDLVKSAVNEFKREIKEQLTKDVMQTLVKGIALNLANDKKLMTLVGN